MHWSNAKEIQRLLAAMGGVGPALVFFLYCGAKLPVQTWIPSLTFQVVQARYIIILFLTHSHLFLQTCLQKPAVPLPTRAPPDSAGARLTTWLGANEELMHLLELGSWSIGLA